MKRKKQLRITPVLVRIEQEIESLLRIPTLDDSTIDYLNQKKDLVKKAKCYLEELKGGKITHSKETALIILRGRLPLAYESLIYQFIEYRLSVQKRLMNEHCSSGSKEKDEQVLGEVEYLIDFLLVEAEEFKRSLDSSL